MEKMVVLARGGKLTARDVPPNIRDAARNTVPGGVTKVELGAGRDAGSIAGAEKILIIAALKKHDGNRTKAAIDLGISRRTLHRKLREYEKEGITLPDSGPGKD